MAFIPVTPPARASGDTAAAYADLRRVVGADMVAKIVQLFSLRPASMRRMIRSWELSHSGGR